MNAPLAGRWPIFGEYKFSCAELDAELTGGGHVGTDAATHDFIAGVSFRF